MRSKRLVVTAIGVSFFLLSASAQASISDKAVYRSMDYKNVLYWMTNEAGLVKAYCLENGEPSYPNCRHSGYESITEAQLDRYLVQKLGSPVPVQEEIAKLEKKKTEYAQSAIFSPEELRQLAENTEREIAKLREKMAPLQQKWNEVFKVKAMLRNGTIFTADSFSASPLSKYYEAYKAITEAINSVGVTRYKSRWGNTEIIISPDTLNWSQAQYANFCYQFQGFYPMHGAFNSGWFDHSLAMAAKLDKLKQSYSELVGASHAGLRASGTNQYVWLGFNPGYSLGGNSQSWEQVGKAHFDMINLSGGSLFKAASYNFTNERFQKDQFAVPENGPLAPENQVYAHVACLNRF